MTNTESYQLYLSILVIGSLQQAECSQWTLTSLLKGSQPAGFRFLLGWLGVILGFIFAVLQNTIPVAVALPLVYIVRWFSRELGMAWACSKFRAEAKRMRHMLKDAARQDPSYDDEDALERLRECSKMPNAEIRKMAMTMNGL